MESEEMAVSSSPSDLWGMKALKEETTTPFGAQFAVKLEAVEWKLVCALSEGSDCSDDDIDDFDIQCSNGSCVGPPP